MTSQAVSVPITGSTTNQARASVTAVSSRPTAMLITMPPWRWSRVIERRCTIALPIPSIGTVTASSWTMMTIAKMPKSDGGINRASRIIDPNSVTSTAMRA